MNAIDQAKELYAQHGLSLGREIGAFLDTGSVVLSTPDRLLLARPILLERPREWPPAEPADAWFVRLAIGRGALAWFMQQMPYPLPFLAWRRGFRGDPHLRVHSTQHFKERLLKWVATQP